MPSALPRILLAAVLLFGLAPRAAYRITYPVLDQYMAWLEKESPEMFEAMSREGDLEKSFCGLKAQIKTSAPGLAPSGQADLVIQAAPVSASVLPRVDGGSPATSPRPIFFPSPALRVPTPPPRSIR